MKTIQLVTPQNVLIEHELANFMMRAMAFALDQVAIIVFLLFCFIGYQFLELGGSAELFFVYLIVMPVYMGYTLFFEWLNHGQTLGKMILGIRVRRLDGNEIGFTEAAIRWLMRPVDIIITAGSLAALLITSTERSQRMGDILAGTIVIRQVPSNTVRLNDLLKINTLSNYVPKYPEVQRLHEEQVVLIKQTLVRAGKHNNVAHLNALSRLKAQMENMLEIKASERQPADFLRTLIKDFIVLTR